MKIVIGVLLAVIGLLGLLRVLPLGFGEGETVRVIISLVFLLVGIALAAYPRGVIRRR